MTKYICIKDLINANLLPIIEYKVGDIIFVDKYDMVIDIDGSVSYLGDMLYLIANTIDYYFVPYAKWISIERDKKIDDILGD